MFAATIAQRGRRNEVATLDWVHCFNTEATTKSIDDLTPVELEQISYARTLTLEMTG
jgi:putative transposase